jgi:hypothetical protein
MPKALPMIDMSEPVCCNPVASGPMGDEDALAVAMRLKAIADPVRIKILSSLFSAADGEQTSGDLSDRRGMRVFHRVKPDALQALCVVLDPRCCQ